MCTQVRLLSGLIRFLRGDLLSHPVATVDRSDRLYPNGVPPRSPGLATQEPTLGLVDVRTSSTPTGLRHLPCLVSRELLRNMTQSRWGWASEVISRKLASWFLSRRDIRK